MRLLSSVNPRQFKCLHEKWSPGRDLDPRSLAVWPNSMCLGYQASALARLSYRGTVCTTRIPHHVF